ncbi:cytochrome-c oxidase, cbb3-type subunit III [Desertibaculum subflavum]|uniref:cytochrome-c oxidase, cbb3-type subunit III n=1 Tax=Desertibaculum subflavum TaxID=2268458 RepID=UPI000E671EF8
MPTKIEKDSVTGTETTGHEWDGIKELNTPLPKWWIYTFYATIAFSLVYYVLYPSIPGIRGYFAGTLGYDQRIDVANDLAAAQQQHAPYVTRIGQASLDDIKADPQLYTFASTGGRIAFNNNCAGCHQVGGAGAKGYPNLADDDWIWGGKVEEIIQTIRHGVRSADADTRQNAMPRFGLDGMLKRNEIDDVANYVLSLSGAKHDAAAAGRGAPIYAEQCVACHGEKGVGNPEVGAPRLSDGIWLYGGDLKSVTESIASARAGMMPSWGERLDEATIKMLAVYVHGLGGGK